MPPHQSVCTSIVIPSAHTSTYASARYSINIMVFIVFIDLTLSVNFCARCPQGPVSLSLSFCKWDLTSGRPGDNHAFEPTSRYLNITAKHKMFIFPTFIFQSQERNWLTLLVTCPPHRIILYGERMKHFHWLTWVLGHPCSEKGMRRWHDE